jgi:hypothetical protein
MSSFEEVLAQYEQQKLIAQGLQKDLSEIQLNTLIQIAAQLKRIADAMEKNDEVIDCDLPF